MPSTNIRVVVRVRPFNARERAGNVQCTLTGQGNSICIVHPETVGTLKETKHSFTFDNCYWSMGSSDVDGSGAVPPNTSQHDVFQDLGTVVIKNAFEGFHSSIFAYGQTGAGKSFTMMGDPWDQEKAGIIPRLCRELLSGQQHQEEQQKEHQQTAKETRHQLQVSYLEIYMEQVRDLLSPGTALKVREHKEQGVYVEGLTEVVVDSFEAVESALKQGNAQRTVAATLANNESSRSHAIFTVVFTQTLIDKAVLNATDRVSKINLVDLAGSERTERSDGKILKEANKINLSLTQLGRVILTLSQNKAKGSSVRVPYRDSVLTWLLRESLGGNSKTAMVAALSPSPLSYEESLRTLKYASRAKRIQNHAVVNEDPNTKIIRELQEEVQLLRAQLKLAQQKQEEEIRSINQKWETKLREQQAEKGSDVLAEDVSEEVDASSTADQARVAMRAHPPPAPTALTRNKQQSAANPNANGGAKAGSSSTSAPSNELSQSKEELTGTSDENKMDGSNEQDTISAHQNATLQNTIKGGAARASEPAGPPTESKAGTAGVDTAKTLEKTSYLQIKQGSKWQASKWKWRWFELQMPYLVYFKKFGDAKEQGKIALADCDDVTPVTSESDRKEDDEEHPKNAAFDLCASDRTYHLQATNEQEMREWVSTLQQAVSVAFKQSLGGEIPDGGNQASEASSSAGGRNSSALAAQESAAPSMGRNIEVVVPDGEGKLGMHIGMVLDVGQTGKVAVLGLTADGRAQRAGVEEGDILLEINRQPVIAQSVTDSLKHAAFPMKLLLLRGGNIEGEHAHHGGQISISFESLKDTARRQGAAAKSFELDVVMHGTGGTNRD